jgi:hypothetical protein
MGMRQLGTVAVDATRIKAAASPDKIVLEKRQQRARLRLKVRSWQKACDVDHNNEGAGTQLGVSAEPLAEALPARLEPLDKPRKRSTTDPDARFCAPGAASSWVTRRRSRSPAIISSWPNA